MEEQENLDNKKYFGNVKKIITKEYFFDTELNEYDEAPCSIESSTYNRIGNLLQESLEYTRRFGDVMGFDLKNSSTEYFYYENDLIKKIINYDENSRVNCITEYYYDIENKLNSIKVDRIAFYQITEFQYSVNKIIKTLTNSKIGLIKKDIILYDNENRIISEETIYEKIKGNYTAKNPSKKVHYGDASFIIEHYIDKIITSKEIYLNNNKLIKRVNHDDFGQLFSVVNINYYDNTITTLHNKANGELINKKIEYLNENSRVEKAIVYKNEEIIESEIIYKYDEFMNCIYEEIVGFSLITTQYEYQ